jgi:hypothetical protein
MTAPLRHRSTSLWRILRAPAAVALISVTGLAAALLGDGWWHVLAWLLLAVPVLVICFGIYGASDK